MPAPSPFNAPNLLVDPGYLWGAPIGTTEPTPT
jgi:hypothetical protein